MALPKWTDDRTQALVDFVGSESLFPKLLYCCRRARNFNKR